MAGSRKHTWHILSLTTIHSLCGNPPGLPRTWPHNHRWVPLADTSKATCSECIEIAKKLNDIPS